MRRDATPVLQTRKTDQTSHALQRPPIPPAPGGHRRVLPAPATPDVAAARRAGPLAHATLLFSARASVAPQNATCGEYSA
eukprot:2324733-Prymnesium_polylepis.3